MSDAGFTTFTCQVMFCVHLGDYLTFERGQQALNSQGDGSTGFQKLEGLMMAMADFHVQMNFLKLIYKMLFKVCIMQENLHSLLDPWSWRLR